MSGDGKENLYAVYVTRVSTGMILVRANSEEEAEEDAAKAILDMSDDEFDAIETTIDGIDRWN